VRVGCCASAGAPWDCSKPLGSIQSFAVDSQEIRRSEAGRGLAPISCSIEYAFVSSRKHNLEEVRFLLLRVVGVAIPTATVRGVKNSNAAWRIKEQSRLAIRTDKMFTCGR
jgi:hypothetical protein